MADTYAYDRPIPGRYLDPVDLVWLATARRLGLTVRRAAEVYACTDGHGTLTMSVRSELDPDDSVAQMVFHEVCHWLVNGRETFHEQDWGFPLDWDEDWRELACQRVQCALADQHGLRRLLASTGSYRPYYDRLGDPMTPLDDSEAEQRIVAAARVGLARAAEAPWVGVLDAALVATGAIARLVRPFLGAYATDLADDHLPSIWAPHAEP
jgi:hypothetical protein